jgi:hypothetical protein
MSIYATLWRLKFPRFGDEYIGCEWIRVTAQGIPPHIGTPTRGFGYEGGDPYAEFLPPSVEVNAEGDNEFMRAVVIVTEETPKGTARSPQATLIHYSFFPAVSTRQSRLSSCTRASAMGYAGQVQGSSRNRLQPTVRCSWYCPTDEFSIREERLRRIRRDSSVRPGVPAVRYTSRSGYGRVKRFAQRRKGLALQSVEATRVVAENFFDHRRR